MNAEPSLGRVTVFTCFHLILNEAVILNYACCSDNPIKRAKSGRTHRQTLRNDLDHVSLSRACMTGSDPHEAPIWTEKLTWSQFTEICRSNINGCMSIVQHHPRSCNHTVLYYFYGASIKDGRTPLPAGIRKQTCKGKRTDIDFSLKTMRSKNISCRNNPESNNISLGSCLHFYLHESSLNTFL